MFESALISLNLLFFKTNKNIYIVSFKLNFFKFFLLSSTLSQKKQIEKKSTRHYDLRFNAFFYFLSVYYTFKFRVGSQCYSNGSGSMAGVGDIRRSQVTTIFFIKPVRYVTDPNPNFFYQSLFLQYTSIIGSEITNKNHCFFYEFFKFI